MTDPDIGSFETEMNRGFLQVLVLALLDEAAYGYAMARTVRELGYELEENTLYPLLRRLEKNGLIKSQWDVSEDRPRKFYAITGRGRALRAALVAVWKKQDDVLRRVLKEERHV